LSKSPTVTDVGELPAGKVPGAFNDTGGVVAPMGNVTIVNAQMALSSFGKCTRCIPVSLLSLVTFTVSIFAPRGPNLGLTWEAWLN
jgi:hypothetical protein